MNRALDDPKLSKFINEEVLKRFWKFGGVRIEDNIFVTELGIENYTPVPRTWVVWLGLFINFGLITFYLILFFCVSVEEIEEWMSKKEVA